MERGSWKPPHVENLPTCPRCGSSNTKFCYYNNYSLTQPRYFCKGCRRYWTKGGSLRNIPVGGGCRKTRRGKAVRISTRHGLSSRINGSIYHESRGAMNVTSMHESSSTSTNPAPNIDLAVVYANYLNQQPRLDEANKQRRPDQVAPIINDYVGGFDQFGEDCSNNEVLHSWSSMDNIHHTCCSKDLLYICGMDETISILAHDQKQEDVVISGTNDVISNYELPPLPGEEMVTTWSTSTNSHMINVVNDHIHNDHHTTLHGSQENLGFEAQVVDEMIGNRSMFDHLPNYGTTFTRP